MKGILVNPFQMSSGNYKIRFWGQPNDHMMDWRGCNYHALTVPGQPRRGFKDLEELAAWWQDNAWYEEATYKYCYHRQGTHLPEVNNGPMGKMLSQPYIHLKQADIE